MDKGSIQLLAILVLGACSSAGSTQPVSPADFTLELSLQRTEVNQRGSVILNYNLKNVSARSKRLILSYPRSLHLRSRSTDEKCVITKHTPAPPIVAKREQISMGAGKVFVWEERIPLPSDCLPGEYEAVAKIHIQPWGAADHRASATKIVLSSSPASLHIGPAPAPE